MDNVHRSKVIVVFADIRGSSRWTRRVGDDEDALYSLMMLFEKESQCFRARTNAGFYKRLGDGRMFTYSLETGNNSDRVGHILVESIGLIKRIERHMAHQPSPRPTGFRVRMMAGRVLEATYHDGQRDWIGYVPNTCHKLLGVDPERPLLIHESVKEILSNGSAKKLGLHFSPIDGKPECPKGVDEEDAEALWVVTRRH